MKPLALIIFLSLFLSSNSTAMTMGVTGVEVTVTNNQLTTQNNATGFVTLTLLQAGLTSILDLGPGVTQIFLLGLADSLMLTQTVNAQSGLTAQDEGVGDINTGIVIRYNIGVCIDQCLNTVEYFWSGGSSNSGEVAESRGFHSFQGFLPGEQDILEQVVTNTITGDFLNGSPQDTFGELTEYSGFYSGDLGDPDFTGELTTEQLTALIGQVDNFGSASQSTAFSTSEFGIQLGSPVPLPPAFLLFISALILLHRLSKKNC